ncbi:acetylcholinesterase precursor [Polyplosphaeria fusca]|uniref:Acetylcholinesterase n=1 Tax=Polyplosphaeria fusca TaxID=682080 RepID=A0A9P4V7K7_9PLEO|nr:acetylcholinesterase precursor [Polyplosphaeria fusca]
MAIITGLLALAIGLASLSTAHPTTAGVVNATNAKTSLTLIYQNNLNASDDKNHVGALVLDPVSQASAQGACSAMGEKLLSKATLQKYELDFIRALAYQDYADYSNGGSGYFIENGVVAAEGQLTFSTSSQQQLPVLCTQSANNGTSAASPVNGTEIIVQAGGNSIIGYRNQKSFRFLGIPYADTPRRWKYTELYSKKGQTIQATAYGPQCAQGGSGSEDCLFINIQTPYIPKAGSKKQLRPVLFWIHGGGFTGGTGADPVSDGGNLASREDIVVVTMNYRLSTLGFLAIPGTDIKGNYGIADQVLALDWTRANIAAFGGDPSQITIIGGSAGAGSVRVHLGSQAAIGKFQGAVQVSNLGGGVTLGLDGDYGTTYSSYYTISESYVVAGQKIFAAAGCNSTNIQAQISCLEKVPASTLVQYPTVARYVVQDGKYVDTEHLIVDKRNASTAHVPVILGVTRDDGASFSTYPKSPIANHSQGLQEALGINSTWAQRIIDSNLFPLHSTGNLTLDSFNVSVNSSYYTIPLTTSWARIATDKTFRCIDQATVHASTTSSVFPRAYFYQFDRTTGGYDPNGLGGPAGKDPRNPYFRLHGAEVSFIFGVLPVLRDAEDLYTTQLVAGYFGAFARNGDPNPDLEYLRVRGYERMVEAVEETGEWGAVGEGEGEDEIRVFDWPGSKGEFVDVEQCEWLGYGLDYYLKGGK